MPPYKAPSFQDRIALADKAKKAALEKLKARPKVDEAELAERRAARLAREEAQALERAQALRERAEAKAAADAEAARIAEEARQAAAEKAARLAPLTAAEMKAARDARYAARKARQGR